MRTLFLIIIMAAFIFNSYRSSSLFKSKTGIDPNVLSRTKSSAQKYSYGLFKANYAGYFIVAMIAIFRPSWILERPTFDFFDHPFWIIIGFMISMTGIWLMQKAHNHMGDSWRIGIDEAERTELLTDGPFTYCRNPVFSGILLALFGTILIIPHWISLLLWVVVLISINYQARMEEDYLIATHGEEYLGYAQNTGRFMLWIGQIRN